ncbi:hypothetical protein EXIGLDRAFT_846260 [Exidia glandulosa HHB12029]|uniref:Myb-like domain-containing protein n=1 Tax=Exidia glandulosa HHB12029 TaxID=1314781 RepID=A0A165B2Y4_EXIGL|nr:hypothetical protein EXIGLDRAFT_846260 [Exidia glandulosa HHB12029]
MRTDFREERKWKVALAHDLALACKAWYDASPEDRPSHCSKWSRLLEPEPADDDDDDDFEMDEAVDDASTLPVASQPVSVSEPMIVEGWQPPAYGTPDPLGPPSPERVPAFDPDAERAFGSATHSHLEPVTDDAAPRPITEVLEEHDVALKTEEVDQPMLGLPEMEMDVDAPDAKRGQTANSVGPGSGSKLGPHKELRDPILELDNEDLWIEFGKLLVVEAEKPQSQPQTSEEVAAQPPPPIQLRNQDADIRLPEIFPELDPYDALPLNDFDIAMNLHQIKDRPSDKRIDDTYGKVTSTNPFMDARPTLISALNPAQKWRNGEWFDLDDAIIQPTTSTVDKELDPFASELFRMHGTSTTPRPSSVAKPPQNPAGRAAELSWTKADDELLKSIVERIPNNWMLVAEWFNSSRLTIASDKRSAWDCCERWHRKFGLPASAPATAQDQPRSPSPTFHHEHPTVRILKRLASQAGLGTNTEPKKRRRLLHMQDAVRKVVKKREQQQRSNLADKKRAMTAVVHETHTKIAKTSLSALELTRMKADRDNQEREDRQRALRQSELQRQAQQQLNNQREMILKGMQQNGQTPQQLAALRAQAMAQGRITGAPPGMVPIPMQNLTPQQRAHMMAAHAARANAGSSSSPQLHSSPPQTSPPRPGHMQPVPRPGSTVPTDPAAFQAAQQQALHAVMMQGYSNDEQMRQRVAVQTMLGALPPGQSAPGGGRS